jgi:GT2 family glycosyltransferase
MTAKSAPFFSVVIPAYNAGRWIGQTLESFASQTVGRMEVIVVDDGSTDNTVAVAEAFAGHLDLRVVRERHSGAPAHPCNVGTILARGELIVCCDADDLAAPDRLQSTHAAWGAVERQDCLIFSDHSEIDEDGGLVSASKLSEHTTLDRAPVQSLGQDLDLLSPEAAFDALLAGCFIRPCSAAIPKSVLQQVGGYDERLRNGQDYDLYLRVAWKYPFLWVKRKLGLYRRSGGNISSRPATQLAASRLAVLQRLLTLPLAPKQERTVQEWISLNYQALGYEYSNRGQLGASLKAYCQAYKHRANLALLRGMAASLAKWVIGGQRRKQGQA